LHFQILLLFIYLSSRRLLPSILTVFLVQIFAVAVSTFQFLVPFTAFAIFALECAVPSLAANFECEFVIA